MAKTIEEMAEIYMNKNRLSMYDEDTGEVELIASLVIKHAYQYGANAVLEEVESLAFSDIGSYKSILDKIQNKIKQLKGEQL